METKSRRPGQRGKSIDERIVYALGHRVRIEILRRLLSEGAQTADGIAAVVGESRQNVHHHLRELLDAGAIEIAKVEKKRNAELHYYCGALVHGKFDLDAQESMTPEQRQEIAGMIVQHSSAELIAALATGQLSRDPRFCLMWNWINLDDQGREELFEVQEQYWERIEEIEAEAINRSAESGEPTTSYIVSQWGFERAEIEPASSADADKSAKSF